RGATFEIPNRVNTGTAIQLTDQVPYSSPHTGTTRIAVAVRPAHNLGIGSQWEVRQYQFTGLAHGLLALRDGAIDFSGRGLNHQCVMHGATNSDPALRRQDAGEAQHFGAVRLQWEIAQRTWVGVWSNVNSPTKCGLQFAGEHGFHFHSV